MNAHAKFECGNIEFVSQQENIFQLKLRKDTQAQFSQWFYFAVSDQENKACQFHIINAHESSYPEAWQNYQACMSTDRKTWRRVPTRYDGQRLIIEHTPTQNLVFYAYFAAYSYEDYLNWIARVQTQCATKILTTSTEGRMLHLLQIGEAAPHKRKCWFTVRQHSGEVMASWFVEKLIEILTDANHPLTQALLKDAVFYIVPMMNPDGVANGNLRANANGLDLNRQWKTPDATRCPEVFYTRQKMHEIGVDFFLDVHGDEGLPYVFLADAQDNLNYTTRQAQLAKTYSDALLQASPEFQTTYGYDKSEFKETTPTLACNYVAEHFDCLSLILEMPFKDNANKPDLLHGWSPARSADFSVAILQALQNVLPMLR